MTVATVVSSPACTPSTSVATAKKLLRLAAKRLRPVSRAAASAAVVKVAAAKVQLSKAAASVAAAPALA
jgi:hypothetical protein